MIEETFTDAERQLLIVLTQQAMVRIQDDSAMRAASTECFEILSKLYGTDTVLVARRAYPSLAARKRDDTARQRAAAAYSDPSYPERLCDYCRQPYRGPAVYCSLVCAEADA